MVEMEMREDDIGDVRSSETIGFQRSVKLGVNIIQLVNIDRFS